MRFGTQIVYTRPFRVKIATGSRPGGIVAGAWIGYGTRKRPRGGAGIGALKLLLLVFLLPAHAPVCKLAVADARPAPASAPAPSVPPCCSKCKQKPSHSAPAAPEREKPAKPVCPPNAACPFCAPPPALAPAPPASAELDGQAPEQLAVLARVTPPDGVRTLLDRPPRA